MGQKPHSRWPEGLPKPQARKREGFSCCARGARLSPLGFVRSAVAIATQIVVRESASTLTFGSLGNMRDICPSCHKCLGDMSHLGHTAGSASLTHLRFDIQKRAETAQTIFPPDQPSARPSQIPSPTQSSFFRLSLGVFS